MRSMSPADAGAERATDGRESGDPPPGRSLPPGYDAWDADMDDPDHWQGGTYLPPYDRRLRAREAARPHDALLPHQFTGYGFDADAVEAEQLSAFEAGVERWWLAIPPGQGEDPDIWHFAED